MSTAIIVYVPPDPSQETPREGSDRVTVQDLLQAAAFLCAHPERWEEFKMKFGLATADAALKLAARSLPPEVIAALRAKLGL